jgi:predicted nucleic acid-binding protein
VTLVDTSAWVEYLRGTGSDTHLLLRSLIRAEHPLHTTEVVLMEVLAGGRDEAHVHQLRRLLLRCEFLSVDGLADFEVAASLYRRCRRAGETVRVLADCLIAAVAIRSEIELLHADKDLEALARHTNLKIYEAR